MLGLSLGPWKWTKNFCIPSNDQVDAALSGLGAAAAVLLHERKQRAPDLPEQIPLSCSRSTSPMTSSNRIRAAPAGQPSTATTRHRWPASRTNAADGEKAWESGGGTHGEEAALSAATLVQLSAN